MCLTIFGETSPSNKLCGNHGSCVENICVCEPLWTRSLDFVVHTYAGTGAEEIFNFLKQNQSKLSLGEFSNELSLSAPCTKNLLLWNLILIVGIIISLFSLTIILVVQKKKFKSEIFEVLKVTTIFSAIFTNTIKLVEQDTTFPFSLAGSLGVSSNFLLVESTFYFFFVKHAKYHLKKTKLLYSLRPKFYGYNVEKLFYFHINFIIIFDVIGFGGCPLIQTLIVQCNRNEQDIDFKVFDSLRYIQIIQSLLAIICTIIILLVCHIVMEALKKDLKLLSQYYIKQKEMFNEQASSNSDAVEELLTRIEWTKFMTKQIFIGGLVAFSAMLIFPPSEVIMQYFGPTLVGIGFPLID
eukprot:snap_masked-scaffold_2-processed-gene-10.12-mRNA-1 protein AED:1.00 eAED:1.00 QI:0/0/0/0/1/1/3/0/352